MNKEFLGQRRIVVNMAKRKDGSICCTGTRFYIPEEETGTVLFVKPEKDGFEILKNEKEGSIEKEVKGTYNPLMGKDQTRINFHGLVNETTLYNFYKTNNGYKLEKSREQIPQKMIIGGDNKVVVISGNNFTIPEAYFRPLCKGKDKDDYRFVIEETIRPTQSVKITIVPKDEKVSVTGQKNIMTREIEEDKYIRKNNVSKLVHFSRFFVTAADLHTKDVLYCRWNGSNSIVIEKVEKCDICGRPVNQSRECLMKMDVCSSCSGAIKILKKYTEKEHNLGAIKEALEDLKKQVNEVRDMEGK